MRIATIAAVAAAFVLAGCGEYAPSSDERQEAQNERILQEGTSAVGMPNIVNFTQRRLVKDILEMNDQASLVTYSYVIPEMTGRPVFFCNSIGYPIPYATQFTNPERFAEYTSGGPVILPQADPDGLFRPGSAEGSWVLCVDPQRRVATPVYSESRITASQFPLTQDTPQGTTARVEIQTSPTPASTQQ